MSEFEPNDSDNLRVEKDDILPQGETLNLETGEPNESDTNPDEGAEGNNPENGDLEVPREGIESIPDMNLSDETLDPNATETNESSDSEEHVDNESGKEEVSPDSDQGDNGELITPDSVENNPDEVAEIKPPTDERDYLQELKDQGPFERAIEITVEMISKKAGFDGRINFLPKDLQEKIINAAAKSIVLEREEASERKRQELETKVNDAIDELFREKGIS